MAIASITIEEMRSLVAHDHPEMWEVVIYSYQDGEAHNVAVECTRCGEVLIELINKDRILEASGDCRTISDQEQKDGSRSS